jgi:glutathione peroxidase-family protein
MRRLSWTVSVPLLAVSLMISQRAMAQIEIGTKVPDFTLKGLDGKMHSLADYKGKTVVLEWTNPNCPFVQRVYGENIMPTVQKDVAGKDVVWLSINSTNPHHRDFETAEDLKQIYADWGARYTEYLLDPEGKVGRMFDARTTPHMFVITADGKLVYDGAIDDDPRGAKTEKVNYVKATLADLRDGKKVDPSVTRSYGCSVKY